MINLSILEYFTIIIFTVTVYEFFLKPFRRE